MTYTYAKISPERVTSMVRDMLDDLEIEQVWQGDTRLERESDGTITEWRVVAAHVNGKRFKAEIR